MVYEMKTDFPEIYQYFDPEDQDRNKIITEFWALVYTAADKDYRRAKHLFDLLWSMDIRCKADFDCQRLLNLMQAKGIGKVYGKIVYDLWVLRLKENIGEKNLPKNFSVPLEMVMEVAE